jgi:hypothetical protein
MMMILNGRDPAVVTPAATVHAKHTAVSRFFVWKRSLLPIERQERLIL